MIAQTEAVVGSNFEFGYSAAESSTRRRVIQAETRSEDRILDSAKRGVITENAHDLRRNFALAAWAIRKHLDYVASFSFQSRSDDEGLNREIEALVAEWSKPANCEVTGRHSLNALTRLIEAHATVDGDVFVVRLANGQIQAIEGDRVRNPRPWPEGVSRDPDRMVHGVYLSKSGRARSFAVHRRKRYGGFEFERMVAAKRCWQVGIFERLDQVRGVTPFSSALNTFRDLSEGFDLALAKIKVAQLFGMKIQRQAPEPMGELTPSPEDTDADAEPEETKYEIDFGKGPFLLDMDPGDDASFLENRTPSSEFQSFTQTMLMLAIKALDLPLSFFDEAHSTYSGARIAWLQYEASAEQKRERLRHLLTEVIRWRLGLFALNGELVLPAGMTVRSLPLEFIARGVPWIDPLKEIKADIMAVQAGLDSPQRILKRRGLDAIEILRELRTWNQARDDLGLSPQATQEKS